MIEGLLLGVPLGILFTRAARTTAPRTILEALRPPASAGRVTIDPVHPGTCRCKGSGRLASGDECPMIWTSREAPPARWLIGRIPRGSQR